MIRRDQHPGHRVGPVRSNSTVSESVTNSGSGSGNPTQTLGASAGEGSVPSSRVAAAVAAGIFAGLSVWGFAQSSHLLIWAAFIGWASYDTNGGGRDAVIVSSASLVFGVLMAWLVAIVVAGGLLPWSSDVSSAIAAAIASVLIVLASAASALSSVPSTFCGFASMFAFLTLVKGADSTHNLGSIGWGNAGIAVAVSLLIGIGLGVAHGQLARLFTASPRRPETRKAHVRLDGSSRPSKPMSLTAAPPSQPGSPNTPTTVA